MKITKKLISVFLCVLMIMGMTLPVYASNARMNHAVDYNTVFYIDSSGVAETNMSYVGNGTTFTNVTVETYIQKRSLGLIWTKVDNGEPDKTWVDNSSSVSDSFSHDLKLDSAGTYRAVFKITFSGSTASDDVITDRIEADYN